MLKSQQLKQAIFDVERVIAVRTSMRKTFNDFVRIKFLLFRILMFTTHNIAHFVDLIMIYNAGYQTCHDHKY
jgi:hypothetical protein